MANFSDLAALDVVSNAKGQKNAVIVRGDGQNAFWVLQSPVSPIWQPSAFKGVSGEATGKLSLCVTGDADLMLEAVALDDWAKDYACQNSDRMFGKTLSKEQISDRYNGVFKKADKYPSFIKFKLGVDRNAPNYWSPEKQKRDQPEDFTKCLLLCRLRILGFWYMSTSFGLTVQLCDAQVTTEQAAECPF